MEKIVNSIHIFEISERQTEFIIINIISCDIYNK